MRHRAKHSVPMTEAPEPEYCPECHHEPHAYHASHDGDVLQRLEHVEHLARTAFRTAPPEAARAISMPAPRAVVPEETLWQGRASLLASTFSALAAATWTGLGALALGQTATVAAHLAIWHRQAQAWLFTHGAFEFAWWYEQGVGWLVGPAASDTALPSVLLGGTLSAGLLLLVRLRRALRTSYSLTTQRLSTRQGGHSSDVALAELDKVQIRRPFWGRRLGYIHRRFVGQHPVTRRVRWWGVPQRALLLALLQATLQSPRAHHYLTDTGGRRMGTISVTACYASGTAIGYARILCISVLDFLHILKYTLYFNICGVVLHVNLLTEMDPASHEIAQKALSIYADCLQALLEPAHTGEFVAIEPTSGAYFVGATLSETIGTSRSAYPSRLAYAIRIGHRTTVHMGAAQR